MGVCRYARVGVKCILLILLLIITCGTASGAESASASSTRTRVLVTPGGSKKAFAFSKNMEVEFSMSAGPRKDELSWSIAGSPAGTNPNVLSELAWTSVDSYQITLANRVRFRRHFYCRSQFDFAWVQDGTVRDSDYDDNDRTDEWSRSISESSGDEAWDISTSIGYAFPLCLMTA